MQRLPNQISDRYKKLEMTVLTYADLFERVLASFSRSIQESVLRKARPGFRHVTHFFGLGFDDTLTLVRRDIAVLDSKNVANCFIQRSLSVRERDQLYKELLEQKAQLDYIYGNCFFPQ
jgi:hypothetical protein